MTSEINCNIEVTLWLSQLLATFFNTSFQEHTISDLHHNLYSSSLWPKLYKCVHLMYFFCSFTIFSFKLQFAHCYTWSKWMIIFHVMVVMCRTCLSEMPSNDSLIDWLTDSCFCKRVNFQGKLTKLLRITCVELSVWLGVGSKTSIISSVVGSQLPVLYQFWTHH